ncbi:hypothetical protein [Dongia sp.]|uniref:hypothetical protein n=1 Tax=Dongia sp. TaxID=1977262 RepID=UPI0035B17168
MQQQMHWQAKSGIESISLQALERAWHMWTCKGGLPSRSLFDPMDFPDLLPWLILGEIADEPNAARPYDILFRYVGRELALYFNAANLTRMHLGELGAPFTERWFAVYDAPIRSSAPCYFSGAPFGTGYEYVPLEILALPFAKVAAPEIGFVLTAFARMEIA